MEFFRKVSSFPFMRYATAVSSVSVLLVVISVVSLFTRGLNLGIDFTGGVLLEVGYKAEADLEQIRSRLGAGGYPDAQVQNFGTPRDVLVRLPPRENAGSIQLKEQLTAALGVSEEQVRRIEFVGPQVGKDLTEQGTLSVLAALALILLYVMLRFQWKFALGAVLATAHDAIVTIGVFSVFWLPFDLSVVAAVLAIVGYSLNDTVVVFDRIRDNFRSARKGPVADLINRSVNETLSRTILTSLLTLLVVVALLVFGGEALRGFSTALAFGIVFGTYSSIYIGSAIAFFLKVTPQDLLPVQKDDDKIDDMP
ncbi:MAG: protein translocase subunit SecF [Gammaproteobacteria bacterium]|nr:protein translocase subunit SecF [Gammaproteobacteria bacterium]